jgi:hypothetical protein
VASALAEPARHATFFSSGALLATEDFVPVTIPDPGAGTQLEIDLTNTRVVRLGL